MGTVRSPAMVRGLMLATIVAAAVPVHAQESAASGESTADDSPAAAHMRHVADAFRGTPDRQGALPTAVAEAAVAAQHAALAARDRTNLDAMQRHAGHVLHALDPTLVEEGPGAGYGARKAADVASRHIALAGISEGATDLIRTHAEHVSTAAANATAWADEAIDLATRIREAETAEAAAELLDELVVRTGAMVDGTDADGDGRIGWQEGEGGLAQATTHMALMKGAGTSG
jgi:hypothetical protein